jgi:hypothetical protein
MKCQHLPASLAIILCFSASGTAAIAADNSVRSDEHARRSYATALDQRSLPILARRSVRTPEATLSALAESLRKLDQSLVVEKAGKEAEQGRITVATPEWKLSVFGDGSAAEFIDLAKASKAREMRIDASRKMSFESMQSAGRDFISRVLADTIVLGPGERLEPELATARIEGGVAVDGSSGYSSVVANRIVFTREVDGVPVIGAGSKVTITFLNDASVESFRYDWPRYVATDRNGATVDINEVLNRISRVVGTRPQSLQRDGGSSPLSPEQARQGRTTLQRLKCGYYDSGAMVRDVGAPVQSACYYHLVEARGEGDLVTRAARSGAVPAGQRIEMDRGWPEAAQLLGIDGSAAPDAVDRPVPSRPQQ